MGAGIGLAAVGVWDTPTWVLLVSGVGGWGLMSAIYTPMLKWYGLNRWWGPLLPIAGLLYTLMTVDSGRRSWMKRGGGWKGRTY